MFALAPHRRTLPAALRDLEHPKPSVRHDALRDLVHYGDEHRDEVIGALGKALQDEHFQVRGAAALALADLGGVEALPALLVAIEDEHAYVRQMALTALGEIGDARARERLRRALRDERPEVRFQAIIAFSRVAPDEAVSTLIEASRDEDANIRYIALRVAEEHVHKEGSHWPPALLERAVEMLGDEEPKVRIVAAVILGRAGRRDGVSVLADLLAERISTDEPEDEAAAVELVGELGLRELQDHLERRAFGLRRFTRQTFAWQARTALARLGHPRAKNEILRELRSFSRDKRTMAAYAAGQARIAEAIAELERMRDRPDRADPTVVAEALAKLALPEGTP